jgi:hypothetical protein
VARTRKWQVSHDTPFYPLVSQKVTIMLRRSFTAGLVLAATGILGAGKVLAAPKTYKYRCPRCQLIQEFAQSGIKKCPKCNFSMVPVN